MTDKCILLAAQQSASVATESNLNRLFLFPRTFINAWSRFVISIYFVPDRQSLKNKTIQYPEWLLRNTAGLRPPKYTQIHNQFISSKPQQCYSPRCRTYVSFTMEVPMLQEPRITKTLSISLSITRGVLPGLKLFLLEGEKFRWVETFLLLLSFFLRKRVVFKQFFLSPPA